MDRKSASGRVKTSQRGRGMGTIKGKITTLEKRKNGVLATHKAATIWINVSNMKAICTKGKTIATRAGRA